MACTRAFIVCSSAIARPEFFVFAMERHWQRLTPVSLLLVPLSLVFCALVWLRRSLYRLGVLRSMRSPVPVIVVGNITVGGTGKTPLVIWLADFLRQAGYRPGIVTRGYRGQSPVWPLAVKKDTPATLVGDEAVLLARRCGCPVMAGPDRSASIRGLLDQNCNLILSDDGLQHYRLRRDLEIAVVDGTRRFGNGLCLPAGPLREPVARFNSVALRVANGEPGAGELGMQLAPTHFYSLAQPSQQEAAEQFRATSVHAVAGIGNPERFFDTLRRLGLSIIPHAFPDHHAFQAQELEFGDNLPVILTEKDAVKCQHFAKPRFWVLAVDTQPDPRLGEKILQRLKEITVG